MADALRLAVRPIPKPLHRLNLRVRLGRYRWRKLRRSLLECRPLRCEICATTVTDARDINAHEEWNYDVSRSPAVARLDRIVFACRLCHSVEHFMHTNILAQDGTIPVDAVDQAIEHFCRVNGTDRTSFERHLDAALAEWKKLSAKKWKVDYGNYTNLLPAEKETTVNAKSVTVQDAGRDHESRLNAFMQELMDLSAKYGVWIGRSSKRSETPIHFSTTESPENVYSMTFSIPLERRSPHKSPFSYVGIRWSNDPIGKPITSRTKSNRTSRTKNAKSKPR